MARLRVSLGADPGAVAAALDAFPRGGDPADVVSAARRLVGAIDDVDGLRTLLTADRPWALRFERELLPRLLQAAASAASSPIPTSMVPDDRAIWRLPRHQSPGLLALMLLGALEPDHRRGPDVDAGLLWMREHPQELAKLQCLLEAFRPGLDWTGELVVERRVAVPRDTIAWARDTTPLGAFEVDDVATIDDADGCRQADFANAFLGGGVFSGGCVQEEIRFAVCPELTVAMLVSPRMNDDEAIVLRGAARLATTSGYAFGLRYVGPHTEIRTGAHDEGVLAIDALRFDRSDPREQWTEAACLRELTKVGAGLEPRVDGPTFATGNWGCGVFAGDPRLKAILQWLAASAYGWGIRYHSFGDARVAGLAAFVAGQPHRTVGELWSALLRVAPSANGAALFDALMTA